ncbi:hypothetical protein ACI2L1_23185 [Streptomyces sp. NPDC019531]|uniref:hypothetical protein n=1 Tax=Streptomyces sp. NPDC019531 TaxID=3365062 RepID=UPI00384A8E52
MIEGRAGGRLGEEGELVDDRHGGAAPVGNAHEFSDGLVPVGEAERGGLVAMESEGFAELAQGVGFGGLGRGEHEAAACPREGVQEEGLALAAAAGDHAEGGTRAGQGGEAGQLGPLEVAVEHFSGFVHCAPL